MKRNLRSCLLAAGLGLAASFALAQEWQPGSADWDKLPAVKKTKPARYMTPQQVLETVNKDPKKVLFLDIRTRAEAMYVGMPTVVDALVPYVEHQEIMADWDDKRGTYKLEPNSEFTREVERRLGDKGLGKGDLVILMCRSGDRSAKAADLLTQLGYAQVVTVPEGFEGDMSKERRRSVNGWKNANLPWSYSLDKAKMYFPK